MAEIKKAIIPIAGLGTRFLPLSKVVPKELWPLVDKPVIQYIVEEAAASGIKEIIFVIKPRRKLVLDYFKKEEKSQKILSARYKSHFWESLERLNNLSKNISFSWVCQKKPLGDGHAVLQAEKIIKNEPCAALWADDVVESRIPCLSQLVEVFEKHQKPIIALYKIPKESIPFYGIVKAKKINGKAYKIEKIVEKPELKEAPSNLAVVGKYVLTPEVFRYLKNASPNQGNEIILGEVLNRMITQDEIIYGCEFEGKWLECGNKSAYLKSNFYLSLKHPQFGKGLKNFLEDKH